jgi:hypothetical protein
VRPSDRTGRLPAVHMLHACFHAKSSLLLSSLSENE